MEFKLNEDTMFGDDLVKKGSILSVTESSNKEAYSSRIVGSEDINGWVVVLSYTNTGGPDPYSLDEYAVTKDSVSVGIKQDVAGNWTWEYTNTEPPIHEVKKHQSDSQVDKLLSGWDISLTLDELEKGDYGQYEEDYGYGSLSDYE